MKERIKDINSDKNTESKNTDSKLVNNENSENNNKSVDVPNRSLDTNISSKR
jgi:hypothetical protein